MEGAIDNSEDLNYKDILELITKLELTSSEQKTALARIPYIPEGQSEAQQEQKFAEISEMLESVERKKAQKNVRRQEQQKQAQPETVIIGMPQPPVQTSNPSATPIQGYPQQQQNEGRQINQKNELSDITKNLHVHIPKPSFKIKPKEEKEAQPIPKASETQMPQTHENAIEQNAQPRQTTTISDKQHEQNINKAPEVPKKFQLHIPKPNLKIKLNEKKPEEANKIQETQVPSNPAIEPIEEQNTNKSLEVPKKIQLHIPKPNFKIKLNEKKPEEANKIQETQIPSTPVIEHVEEQNMVQIPPSYQNVPVQNINLPQTPQTAVPQPVQNVNESLNAKNELSETTKKLHIPKLGFKIKPPSNALILPNLPIPDQVDELEKMITGLNENAFTDNQIKVIKKEMKGLNIRIKTENDMVLHNQMMLSDYERSLWLLRNQRFDEANKLLKRKTDEE